MKFRLLILPVVLVALTSVVGATELVKGHSPVLAASLTLLVIGVPLGYWIYRGGNANPLDGPAQAQEPKDNGDWIMYGGTPSRNMVNTSVKGLPVEWDVDKKTNLKWVANLGSKAYGGPIISGGRCIRLALTTPHAPPTSPAPTP